jgi:hypothetical protein
MTESKKSPRLRTVNKVKPPYQLNKFPPDFGYKLGKEIIYLLATKGEPVIEGQEWEKIFADCIGAEWKPSNVGLDDVVLKSCAWGAKTVKAGKNPHNAKIVRLISGRNSPTYSYGEAKILNVPPDPLGKQILSIWNERVSSVREKYKHLRTVVLLKSPDLSKLVVFEFETVRYDADLYNWIWNKNKNLVGIRKTDDFHKFTWQPSGSQFTIIEEASDESLLITINIPEIIGKEVILKSIGFDRSWIDVKRKNGG